MDDGIEGFPQGFPQVEANEPHLEEVSALPQVPIFEYEIVKANTSEVKDLKEKLCALGLGGWEIASTVYDTASKKVIVFLKRGYWSEPGAENGHG